MSFYEAKDYKDVYELLQNMIIKRVSFSHQGQGLAKVSVPYQDKIKGKEGSCLSVRRKIRGMSTNCFKDTIISRVCFSLQGEEVETKRGSSVV